MSEDISYWIQNSDFSNPGGLGDSNPFESVAHFMGILQTYDWAKENAYEDKCMANDDPCCPAGIGIVKPCGHILHICPNAKNQSGLVSLHHKKPGKLFGLIKMKRTTVSDFENVPRSKFEACVKNFMASDYNQILRPLDRYAAKEITS